MRVYIFNDVSHKIIPQIIARAVNVLYYMYKFKLPKYTLFSKSVAL